MVSTEAPPRVKCQFSDFTGFKLREALVCLLGSQQAFAAPLLLQSLQCSLAMR